jgi:hypothetical protein
MFSEFDRFLISPASFVLLAVLPVQDYWEHKHRSYNLISSID